jgi:hypothetical protein
MSTRATPAAATRSSNKKQQQELDMEAADKNEAA